MIGLGRLLRCQGILALYLRASMTATLCLSDLKFSVSLNMEVHLHDSYV